jgi:hypothetical protein
VLNTRLRRVTVAGGVLAIAVGVSWWAPGDEPESVIHADDMLPEPSMHALETNRAASDDDGEAPVEADPRPGPLPSEREN